MNEQLPIIFNKNCREIDRDAEPFLGMIIEHIELGFLKCTKIRASGINTFEKCDNHGNILPPFRNDKGYITDFGVRLIKFNLKCKKRLNSF